MKIAVIGAGIAGVATAYELSQQGHEVTVFERSNTVAENASFAHLGQQSLLLHDHSHRLLQGHSHLAAFANIRRAFNTNLSVLARHARWFWNWSRQTSPEAWEVLHQLHTAGSAWITHFLHADSSIECEHSPGLLLLMPTAKIFSRWEPLLEFATSTGSPWKKLNASESQKIEVALKLDEALHCGIHVPREITGNCRQFAISIKKRATQLGAKFQFGHDVEQIQCAADQRSVTLILAQHSSPLQFHKVIICTGEAPKSLLEEACIPKNTFHATSHTLSVAIKESLNAPSGCVFDTESGIAIARIGNRIRVAGATTFGKDLYGDTKSAIAPLYQALEHYFPNAAQYAHGIQTWRGSKTYTSDHLPLVGPTKKSAVWLNLAHGDMGWPLAAGAALLIAQSITHDQLPTSLVACSPSRFS